MMDNSCELLSLSRPPMMAINNQRRDESGKAGKYQKRES